MADRDSGMTVLIFEAVSGGGFLGEELPPSWLAEGSAIRRSLVADFAAVPGVRVIELVDRRCAQVGDPLPSLPNVDQILIDADHPVDLEAPVGQARWVIVVAPESGGMLDTLSNQVSSITIHHRTEGQTPHRSLGSPSWTVRLCGDKLRLADHFRLAGIPTPPVLEVPIDGPLPAIDSPSGLVVVKPVDGAGAVDTFILDPETVNFAALPRSDRRQRLLVQPFRPGQAYSASFLVAWQGEPCLLAVGRQAIALKPNGAIHYEGGELPVPFADADLDPIRRAVAAVPGLWGFVGVDFVVLDSDGAVEVLEINPRVTTSIVALTRVAPPGTIARAWLAAFQRPTAPPDWMDGLTAIRSAPTVRFRADGTILSSAERIG